MQGGRAIIGLVLVLGCTDESALRRAPAAPVREHVHPANELTTPEPRSAPASGAAQPPASDPEPNAARCDRLSCAIGLSPADVDLGRAEIARIGRWVELEGGVWYFVRDGTIARLRLRPCPPLRGDLRALEEHGFVLHAPRRVDLRDAAGIHGIEGHWLEGRPHSCVITRVRGGS